MFAQLTPKALTRSLLVPAFALSLAGGVALDSQAQTEITLTDASFEFPPVADPGAGATPADIVLPFFQYPSPAPFNPFGWQETGEQSEQQGFLGLLDAGVFLNVALDLGGGFVVPKVPNADPDDTSPNPPNQLAYLRYSAAANAPGATPTTISQRTTEAFEPFTEYTFSIDLGRGQLQAPGSSVGAPPWTVLLSIGYYEDDALVGSGYTPLVTPVEVDIADMNPDASLKDFSVTLTTDDAIFAKNLVIHVQQAGGSTGSVNLDNATLTKTVIPEPSSLALLGLGGLLAMRRRR